MLRKMNTVSLMRNVETYSLKTKLYLQMLPLAPLFYVLSPAQNTKTGWLGKS